MALNLTAYSSILETSAALPPQQPQEPGENSPPVQFPCARAVRRMQGLYDRHHAHQMSRSPFIRVRKCTTSPALVRHGDKIMSKGIVGPRAAFIACDEPRTATEVVTVSSRHIHVPPRSRFRHAILLDVAPACRPTPVVTHRPFRCREEPSGPIPSVLFSCIRVARSVKRLYNLHYLRPNAVVCLRHVHHRSLRTRTSEKVCDLTLWQRNHVDWESGDGLVLAELRSCVIQLQIV
jgi:hypothetical protein